MLGEHVTIYDGVHFYLDGDDALVSVGSGTYLNRRTEITCKSKVTIGERCAISWDVLITDTDYHRLDGAKLHGTYLVQNVAGEPIFRCSAKRARFYLKKGYAVSVGEGTLRFTDDTTEKKLAHLYDGKLSPFFLEVKNDRCVVCGKDHNLTRHHVVASSIAALGGDPHNVTILGQSAGAVAVRTLLSVRRARGHSHGAHRSRHG